MSGTVSDRQYAIPEAERAAAMVGEASRAKAALFFDVWFRIRTYGRRHPTLSSQRSV